MDVLSQAIALHRAGRLAEAEGIYREVLSREPDHAEALQLLGLVACQSGRLEQAEELIARAVALQPENAEFLGNLGEVQRRRNRLPEAIATLRRAAELAPNACVPYNLGLALSAAGQLTAAAAAYRQALALQPNYPEALNNLGLLLHRAGELPAAAEAFQKALALRPHHAEDSNNLGLTLWNLHRHEAALAAFELAVQLKPDFAGAQANRALALRKLGRVREAVGAYEKAVQLNPISADLQRDRATALSEVRAFAAAIAAARRAVELAPEQAEAAHCLGVVLAGAAEGEAGEAAANMKAEAIAAYERALALQPGVAEWEFELAVLRGETPPTAPDAYVKALFDEYAPRFERHLVEMLHYDVPERLLAALRDSGVVPGADAVAPAGLDILDLGSGTGLVGGLFRPYARSLTAVDLSRNMMAAAGARRDAGGRAVYDRLVTAPILPALRMFREAFDLILAADVFIYVGRLEEVLPAAARALRAGGTLAFSLERLDPAAGGAGGAGAGGFDFRLRYRHSLEYIRGLAAAAGLKERAVVEAHLRDDVPPGWIVVLQR